MGPQEDGSEVEGSLVGEGEFVASQGQAAPLLEPVDASLDRVAPLVRLGVESRWPPAGTASPQAVADLVGGLRGDCADPAPAEMASDRAGRIRVVRQDGVRSGPWSSRSASRNTDASHDGLEDRGVTCLAYGDAEGRGACTVVAGEVDFRAQAATGASGRVVVGPGPVPLFSWLRRRAGAPGGGWSPPTRSSRCHRYRRLRPEAQRESAPRCRPRPTGSAFVSGLEGAQLAWQVPPGEPVRYFHTMASRVRR
ncbi:hypothetical protein SUDANB126_06994 [Streptomyces sp. enrichment culture]